MDYKTRFATLLTASSFTLLGILLGITPSILGGCNSPSADTIPSLNSDQNPSPSGPNSPSFNPSLHPARTSLMDVLLFAGDGTWSDEVASLEQILKKHHASYQVVDSDDLDQMSLDDLSTYALMIFPGGEGATQASSLSSETHERLREAVQKKGVSYIGFCAGAFIAVAPASKPGQDVSYGLGIVNAPELDYYYLENEINPDVAMTLETFADGTQRDLLWYGGPVTLKTPGTIVAKYPNGDPAISQLWSGEGLVTLSAVHPAAPQSTRDTFGLNDSDGLDFGVAWNLIDSGINRTPLKTF